jgi:Holliday junction resolvasome RuvABC endonuclease subunit
MKKKPKTDNRWFAAKATHAFPTKFLGIDPSLTSTGVCVVENGQFVRSFTLSPKLTGPERLAWFFEEFKALFAENITGVAVEGYAYASPNNREVLAELGGVLRLALHHHGVPTLIVAPATLRKFILPEALKGKEQTLLATYKRWNLEFRTNDECDAHGLARLADCRYAMECADTPSVTGRMLEAATTAEPLIYGLANKAIRPRNRSN